MKYPFFDLKAADEPFVEEMQQAAARVLTSGRYIGGPEVEALEQELVSTLDCGHAVGLSNGLDALTLMLEAYKIADRLHAGDEVLVPANTFIATVMAVVRAGLTPVLVDPEPLTMNITGALCEEYITPRTRAILTVHLYGRVAYDAEMERLVNRHGLILLEDCAQAIGAQSPHKGLYGGVMAGALGHGAALSFYPTKNVGAAGDAGAFLCRDPEICNTVRALANYGSDVRYHNIYRGANCRMDPIQAAMLRVKLPHLRHLNARRFERAVAYNNEIHHPMVIKPIIGPTPYDCVWHQYVIRVTCGLRDDMRRYLTECGVGTDIHYPVPPHKQPCYADLAHGPLPVAEQLAQEVLSLPIADGTTVRHAAEIAHIINNFK